LRVSRDAWRALSPAPPSSNRTCGFPASGSPVSCHQGLVEPPTWNREFGGTGPWPVAFTRSRWFTHQAALHSLLVAHSQSRPFAPRGLAASSLLWACPTSDRSRAAAYDFAATVERGLRLPTPADLPGSLTLPCVRATPNHPGPPCACTRSLCRERHPGIPSSGLPHRYQTSPPLAGWSRTLLCNEAESGSLALQLAHSPPTGFATNGYPRPRRVGYTSNEQLRGWDLHPAGKARLTLAHQ